MNTIERSIGQAIPGMFLRAGGGYCGATVELDAVVERAAELLREKFSCDIQIRFNSNQKSGGAWLAPNGKGAAAAGDVGVNAALVDTDEIRRVYEKRFKDARLCESYFHDLGLDADVHGVVIPVFVYIAQCALKQPSMANSMGSRPYLYLRQPCVEDAVAFAFENISPSFTR